MITKEILKQKRNTLNFRISAEMKAIFQNEARKEGLSQTAMFRYLLLKHLEENDLATRL